MNPDSKVPDARTRKLVESTLTMARKQIVEHGGVATMAVIFVDDEMHVIPGEFRTEADKNLFALAVRGTVEAIAADTVLFVSEIWTLPPIYTPEQIKALYARYGSVEAMPDRLEAVMANVETRAGARWQALAPIVRQGRAVKLANVRFTDLAETEAYGRLCGWFAPEQRPDLDDLPNR